MLYREERADEVSVDPRRVLPTKINLIRLRREHRVIKRIRKVLEEKRSALILYIRNMIDEYEQLYASVSKELEQAYQVYERALVQAGYEKVAQVAVSHPQSLRVEVGQRIMFAVKVPTVDVVRESIPRIETVYEIPPSLTIAHDMLRKAFEKYLKLIELEFSLRRLLEELKNTQRLINAIDNVVLPNLERAIKQIRLVLEERSREEFLRMKMIKKKLR